MKGSKFLGILIYLILWILGAHFINAAENIANYKIKAKLIPSERKIEGYEIVNWRNTTSVAAKDLCFHLYMNAFKNEDTYFLRESKLIHRRYRMKEGEWGYIDIKTIRLADGRSLKNKMSIDDTIMRIKLDEAVQPGKDIYLEIEFITKLPRVFARTGYFRNFYMVGQWFPKIAVYTDKGWNCHYFHANSEFFADYGSYAVDINVPEGYIVAATGNLFGKNKNIDGTITYSYNIDNVHDFAWTASPDFLIKIDKFNDVEIQLYYTRNHSGNVERYLKAIKAALKYFQQWYGKYPYGKITIIDPPFGAGGAGGMEYPTLITVGSSFFEIKGFHGIEFVTIHEFGHQYWYGLTANNEFEEAWLDEGINSYSTAKIMDEVFSPHNSGLDLFGIRMSVWDREKLTYLVRKNIDPIYKKSWLYYDSLSYAVNSYSKPALFLRTLENLIGSDKMGLIMKNYFNDYEYKHPKTEDFIAEIKKVIGDKLNDFINEMVYGTGTIDYAVSSIKSSPVYLKKGIFDTKEGRVEIGEKEAEEDMKKKEREKKLIYESEIVVERLGEASLPVKVEFIFDDGSKRYKIWDGVERWKKYIFKEKRKIKCAAVDPDNKILLDTNWVNNSLCTSANANFIISFTNKLLFLSQFYFSKLMSLI